MPRIPVLFAEDKDAKAAVSAGDAKTGEAPPSGDKAKGAGSPFEMLLLPMAIFALFYFVVIRPQRKRMERERQELNTGLNKNDRVLTTAGIYGTIVSVAEKEDEVVVKVDDNTRLKMVKASIQRNLTREENAKAAAEAKAQEKAAAATTK